MLPASVQQNHLIEELNQTSTGSDVTLTGRLVSIPPVNGGGYASQLGGRNYYRADNKLAVAQRYDFQVSGSVSTGSWEEYWYDAFGRRVLTRARRSGSPPVGTGNLCNAPGTTICSSYWQRTLWDGDQLLYEWRSPDGSSNGMNDGSAGYVHLPGVEGIDQAVGLIRSDGTRVVNYNWRGLGESSVFATGAAGDASIPGGSLAVEWPGKTQGGVYFTPNVLASGPSGPYTWFGTLAANGGGSTGMLYKRNRYFDPVSGRFTQQDPIGLAGGLNLYGFADGDPVNFNDPFGLCPYFLTRKPCSPGAAIGFGFVPLAGDAYDILSAVAGKDLLTGESIGAGGVAATVIGTLAGSGKLAREAVGAASRYADITKRGARVWNRATNVDAAKFGEGLVESGFERTERADGITIYSKGDRRYVVRGPERSNSGWTADVYSGDELQGKIRLGRP